MLQPDRPLKKQRFAVVANAFGACAVFVLVSLSWRLDRWWFESHMTQSFCAIDTQEPRRWLAARVFLVVLAFAIILATRAATIRRLAAIASKVTLTSSLRIALAVVLALVVSSLILKARGDANAHALAPPSLPPLHPDAELGWAGDTRTSVTLRADAREIPYSFNAEGYRALTEASEPDPDVPTILFAGESITEGVGVRWEEAYPAVVASDLHVQSVDAAVHGYGNDLIYLVMKKELAKLRHPLAVVTFMIPQLLGRDLDPTRPRLVLDEGALIKAPANRPVPEWWKSSPLRKLVRGLVPYHDDSAIALARAIFVATQKEAAARGAYALLVMTNWGAPCLPPDPGEPTLGQRLVGGLDVHWIDVRLDPSEEEHSTYHPNAKAHRVLADAIEKALIDAKVATK